MLMLVVVVAVSSVGLMAKKETYRQREIALEEQIAAEEARKKEIEEFETYSHTKKYIEEVARDKLGLVYEGEILFKDEH